MPYKPRKLPLLLVLYKKRITICETCLYEIVKVQTINIH